MSWAEPADRDTLSELPPPSVSIASSKAPGLSRSGRSSKSARRVGGAASKSERRLLMEAKAGKAGIGAAIAEVCVSMGVHSKQQQQQDVACVAWGMQSTRERRQRAAVRGTPFSTFLKL